MPPKKISPKTKRVVSPVKRRQPKISLGPMLKKKPGVKPSLPGIKQGDRLPGHARPNERRLVPGGGGTKAGRVPLKAHIPHAPTNNPDVTKLAPILATA